MLTVTSTRARYDRNVRWFVSRVLLNEFALDGEGEDGFAEVGELINGDRSKNYPNKAEYVPEGVAWINTGHIEPDGTLSVDSMHYITREKFDSLRSGKIRLGDLVYCLRGATLGKTAIITQFEEGAVASSLVIIRLTSLVDANFAYRFLTSPMGRAQVYKFDNGSAQPNLSANNVKKYWVPLPPLAEQRRIVAKVNELLTLVDTLEVQITNSRTTATDLLAAAVAELTSAATIQPGGTSKVGTASTSRPIQELVSQDEDAAVEPVALAHVNVSSQPDFKSKTVAPNPITTIERRPDIDDLPLTESLARIRKVFETAGTREGAQRDEAIKEISQQLGFKRVGSNIREELDSDLRTAVRRGIIERVNGDGTYRLATRCIEDYLNVGRDRYATLRTYVCAAVGPRWTTLDDAITKTARYLGFARTGEKIRSTVETAIHSAINKGEMETRGDKIRVLR